MMHLPRIFIRTDASILIGTGHVRRCLVIAEQLKKNNYNVIFVCRELEGHLQKFIQISGFQIILLQNLPEPPKDKLCPFQKYDAEQIANLLQRSDFLFIDHYSLDKDFEIIVKNNSGAHIMVLDDLLNRYHQCDSFIDYMPYHIEFDKFVNENAIKLIGLEYLPIRDEFIKEHNKVCLPKQKAKNILIFMGGNDPDNITGFTLEALTVLITTLNYIDLNIKVIVGESYPHIKNLYAIQNKYLNIALSIIVQTNNMADLLLWADVVIGSGGTHTWERLYLQVPSVVLQLADNQLGNCLYVQNQKIGLFLGHYKDIKFENVANQTINLLNDIDLRNQMYENAKNLLKTHSPYKLFDYIHGVMSYVD